MNHQDRRTGSLFQNDLRREDYGPQFYAYYYKQWSNYRMSYHEHDSTEIMYIISGTCRVDVKKENGIVEQAVLKKGQFIFLDAGIPHRLLVEDGVPCRMLNVEFGFAKVSPDKPSIRQLALEEEEVAELLNSAAPYLVLSDPEEVYHILKSLVLELDQRGLLLRRDSVPQPAPRVVTSRVSCLIGYPVLSLVLILMQCSPPSLPMQYLLYLAFWIRGNGLAHERLVICSCLSKVHWFVHCSSSCW